MAERWVFTPRNRLLLTSLDLLAQLSRNSGSAKHAARSAEAVRSILVVELWNIGDLVLTLPFLAQLRTIFPRAKVTMLARPYAREILGGSGLVDEFMETDLAWSARETRFNPFAYRWRELWRIGNELRRRKFDIAFKARLHVREHVLLGISGANRKVAYAFGAGDSVLTDPIAIPDADRQKVEDWLGLLAPFGGPVVVPPARLELTSEERQRAVCYLGDRGISADNIIVGIHPGASIRQKRWPIERFAEIATALASNQRIRVLVFLDSEGYGAALGNVDGVVLVKVALREMMALLERCRLLVCNDSGPMHLAGGLGVPVVAIFGSGIQRWFAPLGDGHQLVEPAASSGAADETGKPSGPAWRPVSRRGEGVERVTVSTVNGAIEKALARR